MRIKSSNDKLDSSKIIISSNPSGAYVLTSDFKVIGKTPMKVNKNFLLVNNELILSYNDAIQKVQYHSHQKEIKVNFSSTDNNKPNIPLSKSVPNHLENETNNQIVVLTIIILIAFVALYSWISSMDYNKITFHKNSLQTSLDTSEIVESNPLSYLSKLTNKEKIKEYFKAEDGENWAIIESLISDYMVKYWNIENPTIQDVHSVCTRSWNITTKRRNEILSIENQGDNTYKVSLYYNYTLKSNNKSNSLYNEILFKFDKDGLINYINEIEILNTHESLFREWETNLQSKQIFDYVSNEECLEREKMFALYELGKYPMTTRAKTVVSFDYNDDNINDYVINYSLENCVLGNGWASDFIFMTSRDGQLYIDEILTNKLKLKIVNFINYRFGGDLYVSVDGDFITTKTFKITHINNNICYGEFDVLQNGALCCPEYSGNFYYDIDLDYFGLIDLRKN